MSNILNRWKGFEELDAGTLGGGEGTGSGEVAAIAEETARAEVAELQVELEQQGQEIEQLQAAVEEHDDAVEELQDNIDGMESLISSGQFNSTAMANLYNRSLKLHAKLGGDAVDRIGVESLGDSNTAQIMARRGMESFMDTVKGYAKKAIEVIKHIFNTVINFFVGLFSAVEKLARREAQIRDRLEKSEKVKEKVKLGGWNAMFDYEKNGLNADPEGWNATNGALSQLAALGKSVGGADLGKFNSAYTSLHSALAKDAKTDASAVEKKEGDKTVLIGQSGGIRVHAEMKAGTAKDLKEAAEFARSIKVSIGTGDVKKLTTGEVAPKATKDVLKSKLDKVKALVTETRNNKVKDAFSKATRDQVIGSLNVLKADDKEKAEEVNEKVALVRAVFASTAAVTQAVGKHELRKGSWTLDAVAAHI